MKPRLLNLLSLFLALVTLMPVTAGPGP